MIHLPTFIVIGFMTLVACTPALSPNGNTSGSGQPPLLDHQQHKEEQSLLNRTIQFWLQQQDSTENIMNGPDAQRENQLTNHPPDHEVDQRIGRPTSRPAVQKLDRPAHQQPVRPLARPTTRGIQRQLDHGN